MALAGGEDADMPCEAPGDGTEAADGDAAGGAGGAGGADGSGCGGLTATAAFGVASVIGCLGSCGAEGCFCDELCLGDRLARAALLGAAKLLRVGAAAGEACAAL